MEKAVSKTKKDLDNEVDQTWRRKGVVHRGKEIVPAVCPACGGKGTVYTYPGMEEECSNCGGTGEVYE